MLFVGRELLRLERRRQPRGNARARSREREAPICCPGMSASPSFTRLEPFSFSIPRLATARLRLREPRLEDFESFAANAADPLARAHIGGGLSRREAWRRFLSAAGTWVTQDKGWWMIDVPGIGAVGSVGIFRRETGPELEIGWSVDRAYWGRGYATEAARAALDYALTDLGDRVIAMIAPDNAPSIGVAERIGMRRETEHVDVEFGPHWIYAAERAAGA
jgi:RimJ/RimL family protein N-acetyltransferase